MEIENELDDQGGQENNDSQSDNKNEGGEDATSKVKIGDAEYTAEELAAFVEKGKNYDELLPDYTKKSQKLAEIEKNNNKVKEDDNIPEFAKDGWEPKTYKELQQAILWAKESGKKEALSTLQQQKEEVDNKKQEIEDFFSEVKKNDKNFDESDFSNFVLKHSKEKEDITLADMKSFYSIYKDIPEIKKLGEQNAIKNQGQRNEKVNDGGGGGGSKVDFSDLRGGDIRDIARSALDRLKG